MSDKTIVMKEHSNETGSVLAVADLELVGKVLKDGKISFTVSKYFYQDTIITPEELESVLAEATNINMIGPICVGIAQKKGIVGEKGIIHISGIPHAQVYKLNPQEGY